MCRIHVGYLTRKIVGSFILHNIAMLQFHGGPDAQSFQIGVLAITALQS